MLTNNIERIIGQYNSSTAAIYAEIDRLQSNVQFSNDYRINLIREEQKKIPSCFLTFKNNIQNAIAQEIRSVDTNQIKKSGDYQTQISNALSFISMMGDALDDNQAFNIVGPFFGDFQTMTNLNVILIKRRDVLPITCYVLGAHRALMSSLTSLQHDVEEMSETGMDKFRFGMISSMLKEEAKKIDLASNFLTNIASCDYKFISEGLLEAFAKNFPNDNNNLGREDKIKKLLSGLN